MKKLESSLKNMLLSLTACSVIAGALLGWVNNITADPIAHANAQILSDAIALVVPGFDNNPTESPEEIEVDGTIYKIYRAMKNGQFIGAAVEASSNGFGGLLTVLVGFDPEKVKQKMAAMEPNETLSLARMLKDRYISINPLPISLAAEMPLVEAIRNGLAKRNEPNRILSNKMIEQELQPIVEKVLRVYGRNIDQPEQTVKHDK